MAALVIFLIVFALVVFMVWVAPPKPAAQPVRVPVSVWMRAAVFERNKVGDEYFCSYCGHFGNRQFGPDGVPWQVDHIMPVSKGGPTILENLTLACYSCNQRKGSSLSWTPIKAPIDFAR